MKMIFSIVDKNKQPITKPVASSTKEQFVNGWQSQPNAPSSRQLSAPSPSFSKNVGRGVSMNDIMTHAITSCGGCGGYK